MNLANVQIVPLLFYADSEVSASEGFECGWAREALLIAYLRGTGRVRLQPQIAADGVRWIDTGEALTVASDGAHCLLQGFGNWLRLRVDWSEAGSGAELDAYLTLKS